VVDDVVAGESRYTTLAIALPAVNPATGDPVVPICDPVVDAITVDPLTRAMPALLKSVTLND
jgi:hypothetical protein